MLFHLNLEFENFKAFLHIFPPPPLGLKRRQTSRRRHDGVTSHQDLISPCTMGPTSPPSPPSPLGLGIKENRAYT